MLQNEKCQRCKTFNNKYKCWLFLVILGSLLCLRLKFWTHFELHKNNIYEPRYRNIHYLKNTETKYFIPDPIYGRSWYNFTRDCVLLLPYYVQLSELTKVCEIIARTNSILLKDRFVQILPRIFLPTRAPIRFERPFQQLSNAPTTVQNGQEMTEISFVL